MAVPKSSRPAQPPRRNMSWCYNVVVKLPRKTMMPMMPRCHGATVPSVCRIDKTTDIHDDQLTPVAGVLVWRSHWRRSGGGGRDHTS